MTRRRRRGAPGRAVPGPVRACVASALALTAAGAGLFAVTSSSTTTSTVQMALAAGVLAASGTAAGVAVTGQTLRTRLGCLLTGGIVPLVLGLGTAALVWAHAGARAGLFAFLPWLLGVGLACALGPLLPDLRLTNLRERRRLRDDRTF